ncbi:phage minor head protein [Nocardioides speluncae]|uniref:phage minor head protein n=1 Tax=Nocardioides speluncae TaxID=2670337 RepID=UPI000D68A5BD|nr:phage minor head protein [Nocardioides speluncae]
MPTTAETLRLEWQLRAELAGVLDSQTRDLVRAWAVAWDEVAPDLHQAILLLAQDAEGGRIRRGTLARNRLLRAALTTIGDQLQDLAARSGVRINADVGDVVDQAGRTQALIIASMLPPNRPMIDLGSWSRIHPLRVEAMVRRTTQQITASHIPLAPQASAAVRRELVRGISVGSNPRHTADRIVARAERPFNGGLSRALTISRTETLDAHRAAAQLGQSQHASVLTGWVWLTNLDPRTCRACIGMHGTMFPLDAPGPEGHQQCRCARSPQTRSWADLGIDLPELDVMPDADAWFARLPEREQRDILGDDGYDAWRAGDFPREQWAELRDNPKWRQSYVAAKPPPRGAGGQSGGGGMPPPAAPPTGPDPEPWEFGPVLGTPEQQAYVHGGEPLPPSRDERGLPRLRDEDNANHFHTYIPDADARATALLQYLGETQRLVKQTARDLAAGEPRSDADELLLDAMIEGLAELPETGVTDTTYTRADLATDIDAAARWLLAQPVQSVGTVWRGLNVDGVDLLAPDFAEQVVAAVRLAGWSYASTSPDFDTASRYAARGAGAVVIIELNGASGIVLDSVGRMSVAPEVLVSGSVTSAAYTQVGTVIVIQGRWAP